MTRNTVGTSDEKDNVDENSLKNQDKEEVNLVKKMNTTNPMMLSEKRRSPGRASNIELLRILCTLMVISLHVMNPTIVGGLKFTRQSGSIPAYVLTNWIFCASIVAVDIFIMISGYFMIGKSKPKLGKVFNLLLICSVYKGLQYLVMVLTAGKTFSWIGLLTSLIPRSYYIWLYCALYLISPYINRIVCGMNRRQYQRLLLVGLILFSVWPMIMDCFRKLTNLGMTDISTISRDGNGSGFTLVNFILCYLIGGYLRKYPREFRHKSTCLLELLIFFICSVVTCVITFFVPKLSGTAGILGYDTIIVIVQAVTLFDFFTRLDIGSRPVINFFAKASFGVFLLHPIPIQLLRYFHIVDIKAMFGGGVIKASLCFLILLSGAYLASALFDSLVRLIIKPVSRRWSHTRLFQFDPTFVKESPPSGQV